MQQVLLKTMYIIPSSAVLANYAALKGALISSLYMSVYVLEEDIYSKGYMRLKFTSFSNHRTNTIIN